MPDFREKFATYKAPKSVLFWSCAGVSILTMVVGFTWGGWVTSGSATERAEGAVEDAVAALASDVCFTRFMAAPDVRVSHAALMEESAYGRDGFLEDGGWTTLGGQEDPVDGAADLCADRLAEVELPVEEIVPVAEAPVEVEALVEDEVAEDEMPVAEAPVETDVPTEPAVN